MNYKKYTREQKIEMKRRYRMRTGSFKYKRRHWTEEEIKLLFDSKLTDRELSKLLERSVAAIQKKRSTEGGKHED